MTMCCRPLYLYEKRGSEYIKTNKTVNLGGRAEEHLAAAGWCKAVPPVAVPDFFEVGDGTCVAETRVILYYPVYEGRDRIVGVYEASN